MQIVVTGAKGFIGRHLCLYLSSLGHRVVGIGHGSLTEDELHLNGLAAWQNGDVSASNLTSQSQKWGKLDALIHLAGGSSVGPSIGAPFEDFKRSVLTTASVLEWLRVASPSTKLVYVSSAAVYGDGHSGPIPETAERRPKSPYGAHKLMCEIEVETYARDFGLACSIVRPFSVYGAGLKKQLWWDICTKISNRHNPLVLFGSGRETRDWVSVEDLCRLLARLACSNDEVPAVVNAGTGKATAIAEVAQMLAHEFGAGGSIIFNNQARSGDPVDLVADVTLFNLLGLAAPIDVHSGVKMYAHWFKSQR